MFLVQFTRERLGQNVCRHICCANIFESQDAIGAPKMWETVGEGDVMIDSRELEGVKDRLVSTEDICKKRH